MAQPPVPAGWPSLPGEQVVEFVPNPEGKGGWYYTNLGGVANVGGAPFRGSFLGLGEGGRQGGRRTFGPGAFDVVQGGYTMRATSGENYAFPLGTNPNAPRVSTTTPQGESARAMLDAWFAQYNLPGLGQWAWDRYKSGVSFEQIQLEARKRPEWKQRFPAMDALEKKGRAVSPGEYIALERSYAEIARAAGLPKGFYDRPDDFGKLISNEVSPNEYARRVELSATAAFQSPPEFRDELARLYDIGPGDLTAFWLDPDRALPLLQQRFVAAQTGAAAKRTGFGLLTKDEAERLAGLGVDEGRATEGFGQLAEARELFGRLPGEEEGVIDRATQLEATFGGNAQALERVRRKQGQRRSQFSGGSFGATREGISGLGTADS